jgi:hypothetical protein
MLILIVQQTVEKESLPISVSSLQLSTTVELILSENNTTCELSCGIWRIGKDDYESIKMLRNSNELE